MIVGSMFEECGSNRYGISDMKFRQSHGGDGMRRGNIGVVCSCCCTCVIDLYEWTDSVDLDVSMLIYDWDVWVGVL